MPEMENSHEKQVPESTPIAPKADLIKRLIAAIIDGVIAGIIAYVIPVLGAAIGAAYYLLRDGLDVEFMDNRSMGKKLMKLRPVRLDGGKVDIIVSVKRNWMFALGILAAIPILGWIAIVLLAPVAFVIGVVEIVLVITDNEGRRWGDKLAGTKVIEVAE
jgi:uncharacterized RDD family membrane protein YckC